MKKNYYYLSLILGLVFGMTMLTACGGDNDDDGGSSSSANNSWVGAWKCSDLTPPEYLIFYDDGIYSWCREITSQTNTTTNTTIKLKERDYGHYSYDKNSSTLILSSYRGNTNSYKITSMNNDNFVLMDMENSKSYTYQKYSGEFISDGNHDFVEHDDSPNEPVDAPADPPSWDE